MRVFGIVLVVVALAAGACARAPGRAPVAVAETRPPLLAALDGAWRMTGEVQGEAVEYRLAVRPVLGRAFTELHMIDVQEPPRYEARLFLGYDEASRELIAHWLDSFGARASIPHGTGRISERTIEFTIPYPDGAFRDTLTLDPEADRWRFTIDAADGAGGWKRFATYEVERAGRSAP
ncbi:MAG: DUF1579 family protein [Thermoanaerobaculia bacterium]|nr:DUF1579 family protein [Thermoanaerobaculia bacterium]MCZ7652498.1 DUF1579 domain-containing protein [Thermoanaerobaculia bacterium]